MAITPCGSVRYRLGGILPRRLARIDDGSNVLVSGGNCVGSLCREDIVDYCACKGANL